MRKARPPLVTATIALGLLLLVSGVGLGLFAPRAAAQLSGCQFLTATGATAAFCDDLSGGSSPGGRAGDLDDRRWAVGRFDGENNSGTQLFWFPPVSTSVCKAGVTSAVADNDILVCDAASGHRGQFLTAMSAQTYAMISLRPRQAFDFTGRTGTISYNVDSFTGGPLSWWTSLWVTDDPAQGATNQGQSVGMIPRNGVGLNFDNPCYVTTGTQMRADSVRVYTNYAETNIPLSNPTCVHTQAGSPNHIEIRLSQTQITVWASDFSPDGGMTFPNFRQVGQAAISLPFSVGYVHYQQEERAPAKYGFTPTYANNYWSNLGFDGPVAAAVEHGYTVPDALTANANGGVNVGYGLLNSPNTTYTCCPQTTQAPFSLTGVDLTGVTSARLAFSVFYTINDGTHNASTISLQYRLNGGAWQTPSLSPDYSKAFYCASCPGPAGDANWAIDYAFPVPVSMLVQGTNTLEIATNGTANSYPPVLANVDLLTFGGAVVATDTPPPAPTSTPTATPVPQTATATSTLVPTATPSPTATAVPPTATPTATSSPTSTCFVETVHDGVAQQFSRPASFCTNQ